MGVGYVLQKAKPTVKVGLPGVTSTVASQAISSSWKARMRAHPTTDSFKRNHLATGRQDARQSRGRSVPARHQNAIPGSGAPTYTPVVVESWHGLGAEEPPQGTRVPATTGKGV